MRYFLLITFSFLILTVEVSAVTKIEKDKIYSGSMHNVFLYKNTIVLPPGSWKAYKVKQSTKTGYYFVSFKNTKDSNQEVSFTIPTAVHGGHWTVQGEPPCEDHDKVFAEGKTSGHGAQYDRWCVSNNDGWIGFINERAQRTPQMKWNYGAFWFRSGSIDINSNIAEKYGKKINEVFRASTIGKKNLNLDFMSELTKKSSSSSNSTKKGFSSYSDLNICKGATKAEGSWDYITSGSSDAIAEARARNLSLEDCNKLTGRGVSNVQAEEEESTIEQKLMALRKLLNDGLITKDDYDKKKNELLEQF